jgi:potassium-transporting ATPase potassium-binding subunit
VTLLEIGLIAAIAVFFTLLIGVVLIVGALTFFPADALGPIVEHLQVFQGKSF